MSEVEKMGVERGEYFVMILCVMILIWFLFIIIKSFHVGHLSIFRADSA